MLGIDTREMVGCPEVEECEDNFCIYEDETRNCRINAKMNEYNLMLDRQQYREIRAAMVDSDMSEWEFDILLQAKHIANQRLLDMVRDYFDSNPREFEKVLEKIPAASFSYDFSWSDKDVDDKQRRIEEVHGPGKWERDPQSGDAVGRLYYFKD